MAKQPTKKEQKASTTTPQTDTITPNTAMPFGTMNYVWMVAGVVVILLGLYLMGIDKETFGWGFLGLTIGPIVLMAGFLLQFVAIFYPQKKA
ncbi:DUF3098 domain-containing protein [Eisenibacter elegans]|uniref:DUF3098 domain-containing protein n=1 Tax=Eisenibacter elegans TaxID=997 RepID=UPI0003F97F18|nr:DUF3098 domain-containing protein [Eisenibacter elegans]